MATHSIAGNVGTGGTAGEIVYIVPVGDYPQPQPISVVADGSKNYSIAALADGVYQLYTAANPKAKIQVILSGANIADVNFSS